MNKLKKEKKIMLMPRVMDRNFTISYFMEAVIEWIKLEQQIPTKIYMYPDEFIKFCYFTNQFIQEPRFVGIPVKLHYKNI